MEHGHRILTLDSNEQLPKGWVDLTLEDICKSVMPEKISEDGLSSDGASSDCQSDDGGLDNDMANLHHSPLHLNDSIGSQTGNHQSIDTSISSSISSILDASDSNDSTLALPPRVIVYTTVELLGLLAVCRRASVDGTFKSMTKLWCQLFIMLVDYKGAWIPIAFGYRVVNWII